MKICIFGAGAIGGYMAVKLVQAGVDRAKEELTNRAQEELEKQVGDQLGEQGGQLIRGILGGDKKD